MMFYIIKNGIRFLDKEGVVELTTPLKFFKEL